LNGVLLMSMKSPRLAIFCRDLTGGGAERVQINLARCFAESGIEVDLVLGRAEGLLLTQVSPKVRIVDLGASSFDNNPLFKLPTSFQSVSSLPKLIRYLRREKPTAMLSASHYSNEIAIIAKYLARANTRVVVSEHIALSIQAKQVEQVSSRMAPLASRLLYPWANGIVAVSHGVARDLAQITGLSSDRIRVIYNPIITSELLEKAKTSIDHPWFAPGEPPVILGTGRFVKQKDFPNLIRAFEKVQKIISARLVILGSGREGNRLKALVKDLNLADKVAFLGFVDHPSAYMAKASVFVLSSRWEGLPTVLIEAMAVGTPIVSTDCESGPVEILDKGKYGELVPVGDSDALAAAILKVLSAENSPIPASWLGQFTLETSTQQYSDILKINLVK
jgi:glycosyltransferase involved in cell wall biosynthesis